eukprot:Gregarina_sp_Poly_1__2516@NODE_1681_length_3545_cov_85_334675_g1104_i0_p2_GENE_NODE_1681_length_3545_cov_85_334675_g1104_i0NODE_1681_length_3545_cov_85_334675_g1104_i0_p2_ORF_typecomplete_len217_score46_00Phosducin/PF02114_16/7e23Thioredoxin/PF00085_20/6_9e03Thioredoxin/PF00085_20/0_00031FtsK_SpoIIIE/PF01580_18/0_06MCPVI/PF02993_14/0_077Methyltransf_25/PF13649_6/1_2e03Methyltransf_25/PF13649_6/1_2BAG/PF02179_16/0_11BAG/PF02179_16/7_9e03_NODE_1681_length_3545_cov_85_334675_g1104_i011931843
MPTRPKEVLDNSDVQRELASRIAQNLSKAMEAREADIDRELEKLDAMDVDELEVLREKRRQQMREKAKHNMMWQQLGHGEYAEVHSEMDFFAAARTSPKVICHFYKADTNTERKEIMDKHLMKLSKEMMDIRFITANVEKLPFVTGRLNIFVLPSIILIKEQKMFHTMIGFEELGRKDDFTTQELVAVLKKWGMLEPFSPDWAKKHAEVVEVPKDD